MSSHQFKPGDPVLVIGGPHAGELTTVTSELFVSARLSYPNNVVLPPEPLHRLDIPSRIDGTPIANPPRWLLPLLDDSRRAEYLQDLNLDAPSEGVGQR